MLKSEIRNAVNVRTITSNCFANTMSSVVMNLCRELVIYEETYSISYVAHYFKTMYYARIMRLLKQITKLTRTQSSFY